MKITLPPGGDPKHLERVYRTALRLMDKHGLVARGWSLRWDRAQRRAGRCNYTDRFISLSAKLMSKWSLEDCKRTILHEIAHALTTHKHDEAWRKACLRIGGDGLTYWGHYGEPQLANYTGTCPKGHTFNRIRKANGQRSCPSCDNKFNRDYLITWKRNEEQ